MRDRAPTFGLTRANASSSRRFSFNDRRKKNRMAPLSLTNSEFAGVVRVETRSADYSSRGFPPVSGKRELTIRAMSWQRDCRHTVGTKANVDTPARTFVFLLTDART
jgi:hypothetical protein